MSIRVLGIDPGSVVTGFGCLSLAEGQLTWVAHGVLRLRGGGDPGLPHRLLKLHRGITNLVEEHRPDAVAVERVFFAKNARSALQLGHARGAIIAAAALLSLPIHEYAAKEVKASVAGSGSATKEQVAYWVRAALGPIEFPSLDASDALALAICHARRIGQESRALGGRKRKRVSIARALGMGLT